MLASKAPIWVVFVGCVTRIGLNTSTEGQKIRRAELFKTERFAKHTEEGPLGRRKAFWARRFDWVLPDANRAEYVRRRPKNSSSGEVQNPMVCKTHRGGAVGAAKSMFGEDDLTRCCLTRIGLNRSTEGPKKPSRGGVQNPVDCKTHRRGAVVATRPTRGVLRESNFRLVDVWQNGRTNPAAQSSRNDSLHTSMTSGVSIPGNVFYLIFRVCLLFSKVYCGFRRF